MIWRGSTEIHESPGSPRYEKTVGSQRVTRIYRGPFMALVAAQPQIGGTMEGTPGVTVQSVDVEPDTAGPKGPGVMTVVAVAEFGEGDSSGIDPITHPAYYEMEWGLIEKALETHPIYTSGAHALSDADFVDIEGWKAESSTAFKKLFKYRTTAESGVVVTVNLQEHAIHFVKKLAKGITSHTVYAPIARRSSISNFKPATTACGTRENPPAGTGFPSGYVWIKTADRAIREGRGNWERTEEWTGSDSLDNDLYP